LLVVPRGWPSAIFAGTDAAEGVICEVKPYTSFYTLLSVFGNAEAN
jgi:hypothetical protein